jgi:hypothetical protein
VPILENTVPYLHGDVGSVVDPDSLNPDPDQAF